MGKVQVNSLLLPPLIGFILKIDQKQKHFYLQNEAKLNQIYKIFQKRLTQTNISQFYKILQKIGKGAYASVYLVQNITENILYAAKVYFKSKHFTTQEGKLSIKNEISILRQLNHENLLKLKEVFLTENSVYLITQYLSGPSLETLLGNSSVSLSKEQIQRLMIQLLNAVEFYQSQKIMHRDIKPNNLIFKTQECKQLIIIDFGLAEHSTTQEYLFPRAGTPGYLAPEIANNYLKLSDYNELCDIFSLGCIMYYMITSKELFKGSDPIKIFEANKECVIEKDLIKIDPIVRKVLEAMLAKEPQMRLSVKEILELEFFSQRKTLKLIENQQLEMIKSGTELSGEITAKDPNLGDFKQNSELFEEFKFEEIQETINNSLQDQIAQVSKYLNQQCNYPALSQLKTPLLQVYQEKFEN